VAGALIATCDLPAYQGTHLIINVHQGVAGPMCSAVADNVPFNHN